MNEQNYRCEHCGVPHRQGLTVCPRTQKRLRSPGYAPPPPPPMLVRPSMQQQQPMPSRDERRTVAPTRRPLPKTLLSAASAPPPPQPQAATGWDDLLGKVIVDRYLVKGPLGRGGMGTVFEAEHLDLGRPVAIKVLSPEQAKKRNATQRFQVEARTAGAIGHPNICEVYDMGMLPDGCPYLVMERLTGVTLQAKLSLEKRLKIADAISIMRGVLAGLSAAHQKNVVHRDIKPENIFLCTEPVDEVKLVDFGVAKVFGEDDEEDLRLTRTGMVMGTPYYMSSEQARGQRDLDARVDVYAAGVVLYECLAGLRPYIAPNYNALLVKIISQDPPALSSFRDDISPALEQVVQKAMARKRKARYQSAEEFIQALAAAAPVAETFPSVEVEVEVEVDLEEFMTAPMGNGPPVPLPPESMGSLEDMPTVVMTRPPVEEPMRKIPGRPGRQR